MCHQNLAAVASCNTMVAAESGQVGFTVNSWRLSVFLLVLVAEVTVTGLTLTGLTLTG